MSQRQLPMKPEVCIYENIVKEERSFPL